VQVGTQHAQNYSEAMADFMSKVFAKSGLSPYSTYLPSNIHPKHTKEPDVSYEAAAAGGC